MIIKRMVRCSICGKLINEDESCNAHPVAEERCCHDCDSKVVIPARFYINSLIEKVKEA